MLSKHTHQRLSGAFIASAMLFSFGAAHATPNQTASGTDVTNTVSVDFQVGGISQDQISDDVTFEVDKKIDVQVTASADATVTPGDTDYTFVYTVSNQGNDAQDFDIDVDAPVGITGPSGTGLTINTTGAPGEGEYTVYISTDATLDTGADTVYDPAGLSVAASLSADDTEDTDDFYVFIVANIPTEAVDAESQTFTVTATAVDDGTPVTATAETVTTDLGTVDTVYADAAGVTDGATDGAHSDDTTLTIASAQLSASKEVTIVDENVDGTFDCATGAAATGTDLGAIPGACMEYTITVTNNTSATVDATDIAISDDLSALDVTFVAFSPSGITWPDGTGGSYSEASGTVSADLDTLAPGDSAVLKFRVTID